MSVAKVAELIAESNKSFKDAIEEGVARAHKTIRNVTGAWVEGQKVIVKEGKIVSFRVILKVTFVLDD
ncbi:MAG: dodecin domain-containing protein [Gemmatimonadetes bacterium]|nr:dodecin domain-containing protein [Gemmatimonadota bacterium]